MYNINYQRLAKLVSESVKALGKTLSDPEVQKTIVTATTASRVTGIVVDQIDKQRLDKAQVEDGEKERLYKEALAKHEAIIKELKFKADLSKERQEYLVDLNERLMSQIKVCRDEDTNE